MSKTYAIADLHGRFDLLEMALAKIVKHVELPATLVTLVVGRAPAADFHLPRRFCFLRIPAITSLCARLASIPLARL
jgi:hypothetical protein